MGEGESQTQQQTQNSTTNPWEPAQPLLQKLLASYGGLNTAVTGGQQGALDELQASASGIPNFGAPGAGAVQDLFNSTTAPQVGMLNNSFRTLQNNIGGTASGAELNPYSTPGFSDAVSTLSGDITDRVKGVYAGAGRSPSGAGSFAGSLGRGLLEGISPMLMQQFNSNKGNQMAAAQRLFDAGGSTASNITQQNQVPLANASSALGMLPQLNSAFTSPASTKLTAANTAQQQPFANLGMLLNPATQIAGLGGQSTGTSNTVANKPGNLMSDIMGGASGAIGLLSLLSDERAKDNIEEVGALNDGQKIYRYSYKGAPETQIGLLAQEVMGFAPDAVGDFGDTGLLGVNYRRATERSARMGRAV